MPRTNELCRALEDAKEIALNSEYFNPQQKQQFVYLITLLLREKGCPNHNG